MFLNGVEQYSLLFQGLFFWLEMALLNENTLCCKLFSFSKFTIHLFPKTDCHSIIDLAIKQDLQRSGEMLLVIECVIACIIFAAIILPTQYKNPIKYIMSYPPEIREKVESLPQYKDTIKSAKKEHILKKLVAIFAFIVLLSAVAYFSGAKTFLTAFFHVLTLFVVINLFDMLVLDIGIFCHSKKLRIAGTEHMDKEYKNYLFHVKGAVKGTVLGIVISLLSAGIVQIVSTL